MGKLSDFREVIKGLKHQNVDTETIKLCPKCGSHKITITNCIDTYPSLFGVTPGKYVCKECGYAGQIILEKPKEEENET
jgi:ssDNA-binding Zn-finger/Zn-ribbon topoisomerase 1